MLQDVHWAVGSFGYFPSYALGAVMAAQFFEALREAVPDVEAQIARGDFAGLMGWLRENVHGQGARVSAQELLKLATGKPLSAAAALRYLESKYLEPRIGSRQRRGMTGAGWRLSWLARRSGSRVGPARIAAIFVPAMPQPLSYHAFADCRTFWAIPNFFNVMSNLPFLIGGALGPALIWKGGGRFIDAREQLPYLVFFLGALLTCFGSAYYHAAPDNPRLVWDRLPMTLGFAGLVAAAVAERVDLKLGLRSLWPLLLLGVDHRHLLVRHRTRWAPATSFRMRPTRPGRSSSIVLLLLAVPGAGATATAACSPGPRSGTASPRSSRPSICRSTACSAAPLSGHTIKHVLAAFAVFAIVRQLRLREPHRGAVR